MSFAFYPPKKSVMIPSAEHVRKLKSASKCITHRHRSIVLTQLQRYLTMMFARQSTRALAAASLRSSAGRKQLSTSQKLALRLRKTSIRQTSTVSRHKSTAAAALTEDYEDDLLLDSTIGQRAAAEARTSLHKAHDEAWMINLGRGNDNEWLTGPRPEEWFTGLSPSKCPGKCAIEDCLSV